MNDEVSGVVAGLRSSFDAGKTRSVEWRKSQLKALLLLLKKGGPALLGGLQADLHKSAYEGIAMELSGVGAECKLMLSKLDEWMAPEEVRRSYNVVLCLRLHTLLRSTPHTMADAVERQAIGIGGRVLRACSSGVCVVERW